MGNKIYSCFTAEEQRAFDHLTEKQRNYVIYRSHGLNRAEACRQAGCGGKNPSKYGQEMETTVPMLPILIAKLSGQPLKNFDAFQKAFKENELAIQKIEARAETAPPIEVVETLPSVDKISDEEAKRLNFYRKIADGTTKNRKITKVYDKDGCLKETKIEEQVDVGMQIKAREKLDFILGMGNVLDMGSINCGDINITIVDASKKVDEQRELKIEGTPDDQRIEECQPN